MGLDLSSGRQNCCLWQHVSPTYSPDSLYSPCNYCWSTTPSWLSTAVAAAHPNKTAPFLRARGTDGRFARHVQSPIYVYSLVTQGLEAPPRTSTSHLATEHGSRPPAAQSRSELSLATRSGPRTMEATCGNGYAPVRGMPATMMIPSLSVIRRLSTSHSSAAGSTKCCRSTDHWCPLKSAHHCMTRYIGCHCLSAHCSEVHWWRSTAFVVRNLAISTVLWHQYTRCS